MTVHPLAAALASLGLEAGVEARDSLAVVTVPNAEAAAPLRDASLRRAVIALAAAHGFKTVALELGNAADNRAPLSGH
ncbi:MAG TPA: hypothetical protein VJO52_08535 [Gemmatimonadaceae bacterium]|nr:hypothetical protein [Gemmatimonadaceae bacterium]